MLNAMILHASICLWRKVNMACIGGDSWDRMRRLIDLPADRLSEDICRLGGKSFGIARL